MTDLEKRILDLRKRYGDYLTQREFMEAAGISSRTAYLANEPDVLSIRQASRITGFHKNSVAKWIQCGYLRSFRWKGDYRISKTEVLVIDDFGIERIKDWIEEKLYRIINARYIAEDNLRRLKSPIDCVILMIDKRMPPIDGWPQILVDYRIAAWIWRLGRLFLCFSMMKSYLISDTEACTGKCQYSQ